MQFDGVKAKGHGGKLFYRFAGPFARWLTEHWVRHDELVRVRQQIRYLSYSELLARASGGLDLSLYELSIFSQNGEDGVLQEIFRRIGTTNRTFVEIGASANEANAVLLADVLGWTGMFVDASTAESSALIKKYASSDRVAIIEALVTPQNLVDILQSNSCPTNFDLLSIDVDGNDYWLWEAIGPFKPRVVVIEYNSALGPITATVKHYVSDSWDGTSDFGGSVKAFAALGERLGYRLVHAESTGVNLFFVRHDVFQDGTFLTSDEVISRVPNFYLYGLRHPEGPNAG